MHICCYQTLSEDFLEANIDYISKNNVWRYVVYWQNLSNDFVLKHLDKFDEITCFAYLTRNCLLKSQNKAMQAVKEKIESIEMDRSKLNDLMYGGEI